MSKTKTYFLFLLAAFLLPAMTYITSATGPDTIWTRDFWYDLNSGEPDYFEFHPTNDSIFIFTSIGRDSNGVSTGSRTAHFVNTVAGQVFQKYSPIRMAHYTPDGNFLIGHNDSTIAYISLDSMKPVRSYPIMKNALGNFTIDEKGKYVYTTGYTDTNKKFGFFRWSIDSGTVEQINLPDSLVDSPIAGCPTTNIRIEGMSASDTAKILLMNVNVDRPYPHCSGDKRIWGIDLNADTVKYDFRKLDPTIIHSSLDKIFPKAVRFIGSGWRYDAGTGENIPFMNVYDVATGDSLEKIHGIFSENYTFSNDEIYSVSYGRVFTQSEDKIIVYDFNNRDTVYIYNNVNVGPIVISPNNEYILQDASVKFVLYPTTWYPTSIAEPKEDTPKSLIYPNPGTDFIEVNIPPSLKKGSGGVSVKIYDVLGIEHPATTWHPSAEGNVRIDVSALPKGVYFVKVGGKVSKFVKY